LITLITLITHTDFQVRAVASSAGSDNTPRRGRDMFSNNPNRSPHTPNTPPVRERERKGQYITSPGSYNDNSDDDDDASEEKMLIMKLKKQLKLSESKYQQFRKEMEIVTKV